MKNAKLKNSIISLIPSKTVKSVVKQTHFLFSELDLVKITLEFSVYREQRIHLLGQLKASLEDKDVRKYVQRLITIEKKEYEVLVRNDPNYVYEVHMSLHSEYERYLCPTFEAALITADCHRRRYRDYMDSKDDIEITKKRIATRKKATDIDHKDEIAGAILNSKNRIKSIWTYLSQAAYEDLDLEMDSIHYPPIFKKGDLVSYSNRNVRHIINDDKNTYYYDDHGQVVFGVNSFDNDKASIEDDVEFIDEACFLFLKCKMVEERTIDQQDKQGYYRFFMQHTHLDFGYLEKVDINSVPAEIKADYEYAMGFLNNLDW